ncbi:hypothetical protein [Luteitalea sp.]|uniref:hypothetical protein n=1 Tax=Luteitalea sp. TaxID=2004800 RepID=UPI0025B9BDE5|nr:hypothetical protein [Luteitalea sp.]
MTLIKELISLPEHVHRGDFVLRLTQGVANPAETLREYVVTPQLVECFDDALRFIKGSVDARSSKATYLHGSFGSGKSHFMAVLHLLLGNEPAARGIPELASTVARHAWTEPRKFLLVPYHMIGAQTMESAILGHYVEHVRRLHPNAPLPGVFRAEGLFDDADRLRTQIGDEAFFRQLNARAGASSGWGALAEGWTDTSFQAARRAAPGDEGRVRLVDELVQTFFASYGDVIRGQEEAYVSLDIGLAAISRHAKDLGYDAVVLFLDELILWLASHAAEPAFVSREGQKLAQLVEAQHADRPIPIVSFVARQRDLRELVGQHVTGSQDLAFADVLNWWEARFHTITLEDRNLPAIAERRVLKPKSEAARQQMDEAFRQTTAVRQEVMDTLLTSTADRQMFRQVYPFSPALVQALVAVSSVLQRERTALKVMLQLLVDHRETLQLGDLVPVGDLFDVIAEGDEAFSEAMRVHFDNANRLYIRKLLPMLLAEHHLTADEAKALPFDDARAARLRGDGRIVKTLLLAALVPEVEAFKALTPARLAALNHGTIRTPIPGGEAREVLRRVRHWAGHVGEIKIAGDEANPTIAIQITGVDTEGIIEQARGEDNHGNRKRLIKEHLYKAVGIDNWDGLFVRHKFTWRGTDRHCEMVYGNVWEMPDESLRGPLDEWRVIVDYPFDERGHTPKDDLARLERFRQSHEAARTLVWIPAFLSADAQNELGTLVVLEHILQGERFSSFATHLPPVERATARQLLENRRSQLRERLRLFLEGAYGIQEPVPGSVDSTHGLSEHFQSLDPGLSPQPPVAASLKDGFEILLGQALAAQFPAHPVFAVSAKLANLRKVLPDLLRAAQAPDGRTLVDRPLRDLVRDIAQPLELGTMAETHFVLGQYWSQHFNRKRAQDGGPVTVRRLRAWIDEPKPRGLPEEVGNLVILLWAEQQQLAFTLHGGPVTVTLDDMRDELELKAQKLPSHEVWQVAVRRAQEVFGLPASPLLNAANVAQLVSGLRENAQAQRRDAHALVERLSPVLRDFGHELAGTRRGRTAVAVQTLLERIATAEPEMAIDVLAATPGETSDAAMGRSVSQSSALVAAFTSTAWDLFEAVDRLVDERQVAGRALRQRVAEALEADELAVPLAPTLRAAQGDAVRLLAPPPPPPRPTGAGGPAATRWREIKASSELPSASAVDTLRSYLDSLDEARRTRVRVSWRVEDKD